MNRSSLSIIALVALFAIPPSVGAQDAAPAGEPPGKEEAAKEAPEDEEETLEDLRRRIREQRRLLRNEQQGLKRDLEEAVDPREAHDDEAPDFRPRLRRMRRSLAILKKRRRELVKRAVEKEDQASKDAVEANMRAIENLREDLGLDPSLRLLGPFGTSFLRYELRKNRDLNRRLEDDDQRVLARLDLGAALAYPGIGRVAAVGTVSRTWFAERAQDRFQDKLDLYEAYAEGYFFHRQSFFLTPRVGRQAVRLGSGRVFGDNAFFQFHRSFDAARLSFRDARLDLDVILGRPVIRERISDSHRNHGDPRESVLGLYGAVLLGPKARLEFGFIRKHNTRRFLGEGGTFGSSRVQSLVLRGARQFENGLGLDAEMIYQFGRAQGDRLRSGAAAVELSYTRTYADFDSEPAAEDAEDGAVLPTIAAEARTVPWLRLAVGLDWAKGDNDPFDGRAETFEPIYPSQHEFQGMADIFGFQNIIDLHAGFALQWRSSFDDEGFRTIGFEFEYHYFRVNTNRDAAYDVQGLPFRRTSGSGGSELGHELDFKLSILGHVSIGYARFFAGPFFSSSGGNAAADYFYISIE